MTNQLAIEGGSPIRTETLIRRLIGANMIGEEERKNLNEVIDNQCLFRHYGESAHFVSDFENEFSELIGTKYALATATGSGAYFCAMKALGITTGDEVIIPAFGWITDYNMIDFCGATPVIAEIDDSMNLSPESFRECITEKTKAVVVIYYQGAAARLDEIIEIAHEHNIIVIEDVAQACGGTFNGKKLGSFGDVACFSLQNNKVITCGDGGVFVTNNQRFYELAVRYHDLGVIRPRFAKNLEQPIMSEPVCGLQWRMGELAGAVALAQLKKLPYILDSCRHGAMLLKNTIRQKFPNLKLRNVKDENDIGIVVLFDLLSEENVKFFTDCIEAEGLNHGPTSGCQTLSKLPVTVAALESTNYWPEALKKSEEIDARTAKIAILPIYSQEDIDDIIAGTVKVLKAMQQKGFLPK